MKNSICYILLQICTISQGFTQKNELNLSLGLESRLNATINPTQNSSKSWQTALRLIPSICYSRLFSNKSSIEIEIKLRSKSPSIVTLGPMENQQFATTTKYKLEETFLSIPITYKLSLKKVNFHLGPCIDYSLNRSQEKIYNPIGKTLSDDYFSHLWSLGAITRVSYSLALNKNWGILPTIYYNPVFSSKRNYFGIGLVCNFKF